MNLAVEYTVEYTLFNTPTLYIRRILLLDTPMLFNIPTLYTDVINTQTLYIDVIQYTDLFLYTDATHSMNLVINKDQRVFVYKTRNLSCFSCQAASYTDSEHRTSLFVRELDCVSG